MVDIFVVVLSDNAKKEIKKIPQHITKKLMGLVDLVEKHGLREAQKTPGYHDEGLKGQRVGERSIRLNRAYRAIYVLKKGGEIEFIQVEEVNKHDYK